MKSAIARYWKVAAALLLVLLVIAVAAWAVQDRAALVTHAQEVADAKALAESRAIRAENDAERIADEAANLEVENQELKDREPEVVVKWKTRRVVEEKYPEASIVVQEYFRTHQRLIEWENADGSVKVEVPDAFVGDTVLVAIDSKKLCKPYIDALNEATKEPPEPEREPLFKRGPLVEADVGYGPPGLYVGVTSFPIEMGSDAFKVGAGFLGNATFHNDGEVEGFYGVGIRIRIQ